MDIKDYIKGKRRGRDANKLERESMNDPFMQEAIDGFDSVQGDHIQIIEKLEAGVDRKSGKKPFLLRYVWVGVAASIALLVGIGLLFNPAYKEYPMAEAPVVIDTVRTVTPSPVLALRTETDEKQPRKSSLQKPVNRENRPTELNTESPAELVPAMIADSEVFLNELNVQASPVVKHSGITGSISENLQNEGQRTKNRIIKGVVLDETGLPVVGASVQLPGKNNVGTITDTNGRFMLSLNNVKADKLQASYIGYSAKVSTIKNDTITFKLEPDNLALNEVVVVGYGVKKKSSLSGAVASVKPSSGYGRTEFRKYIIANLNDSLCGKTGYRFKVTFRVDSIGRMSDFVFKNTGCDPLEAAFIELARKSSLWTKSHKTTQTITFRK